MTLQKISFILVCFLIIQKNFFAQYTPKNNDILNYNQIMFEYPAINNAVYYIFFIAYNKSNNDTADFKVNLLMQYVDSSSATLISDLKFATRYYWKVQAYNSKNECINTSPTLNFALMENPYSDTLVFKHKQRYNIKNEYKDGLIWCDTYHCAINRNGNVVWLFPIIDKNFNNPQSMRDLRLHNNGTISFINDSNIYLINKDLYVLWNGANDGKVTKKRAENYHHSFNIISQNNFYTMGLSFKKIFNNNVTDSMDNYLEDDFIVRYDSLGTIKWLWQYSTYFFNKSFYNKLTPEKKKGYIHPHANSISIDSTEKFIYLNLRNLSRILKINIKTKQIVAQYGEKLSADDTLIYETNAFNYAHDVKYVSNNELTLFNNNSEKTFNKTNKPLNCLSSVMHIKLPAIKSDSIKTLWQFYTNFDFLSDSCSTRFGSVDKLANGNYLVCSGENARLFEVNKNKEIVWDMMFFKKRSEEFGFDKLPQYRIMYSSSLYPYYYTYAYNQHANSITITNEGTNEDIYLVTFFDKKQKQVLMFKTSLIQPNNNFTLKLKNHQLITKYVIIKSLNSKIEKKITTK